MKIEDKRNKTTLYAIKPGEAFYVNNNWYIKTEEEIGEKFYCVNLENGNLEGFYGSTYVEKAYDLKVVIK